MFSLKKLFLIEAIDSEGKLTELGYELSKFPLEPIFAKVLLYSMELARHERDDSTL